MLWTTLCINVFSHGQLYVSFSRATSKENIKIKIQETEIQGRIKENPDKFLTINCVYREIFEEKHSFSESNKDFPNIQNVFPLYDSEQMDIDLISNSKESEYLDSVSECESDSVKTQNNLEDSNDQNNLSSRVLQALKILVQKNAYHSKKTLCAL
jgi:hypothetical protein